MIGPLRRWRAARRLERHLGVWYHPDYSAPALTHSERAPNVVPERAEHVLAHLSRRRLLEVERVHVPALASFAQLGLVHGPAYLEESARPEYLARVFGLAPELVQVDALLEAQRRAVGGTIEAARAVAFGGRTIAINLGGGFHHAAPDRGAGFCVYNDIAVAVALLRSEGFTQPIAVVDLDFHQGDGNIFAFGSAAGVLTYSLHGSEWTSVTRTPGRELLLPPRTGDGAYLQALRETLPETLAAHGARLVFYIAGNDVLAGDALGDFALTPAGVLARDRFVIDTARALDAPVVVTLGGGYSDSAWQCTANLMRWLLTGEQRATRDPVTPLRSEFRRLASTLTATELGQTDDLTFTEEELLGGRGPAPPTGLVLGYYTRSGLELAFERYGLLAAMRTLGFSNLRLEVSTPAHDPHRLRIFGTKGEHEHLLMELLAKRRTITAPLAAQPPAELALLSIEWLLLQDPTRAFTPGRARLPAQEHPGLGLAERVQEMLVQSTLRLGLEGLVARPAHYHNALLAGGQFAFLDPRVEGRFQGMRRALGTLGPARASALVERGGLRLADGTVVRWDPSDFVLPTSDRLVRYFRSPGYVQEVAAACADLLEQGLCTLE